jgi:hypothetical protein
LLGAVPHHDVFVKAMIQEKAVTELEDSAVADQIRRIWAGIERRAGLFEPQSHATVTQKEEE